MTREERIEASIRNNLSIMRAWSEGRIKITTGCDDMANSTYNITTIISIMWNNSFSWSGPVWCWKLLWRKFIWGC